MCWDIYVWRSESDPDWGAEILGVLATSPSSNGQVDCLHLTEGVDPADMVKCSISAEDMGASLELRARMGYVKEMSVPADEESLRQMLCAVFFRARSVIANVPKGLQHVASELAARCGIEAEGFLSLDLAQPVSDIAFDW